MSKKAKLRTGILNGFWNKKHSLEAKGKMKLAWIGRKKRKWIPFWLGKKKSLSSKRKISITRVLKGLAKGIKNPGWIDGRRLNGQIYPYEFKRIREKIRKRDFYYCQNCGISQIELKRKLDIHHINYNTLDYKIGNLISLCSSCNTKANYHRIEWQNYFSKLKQHKDIKKYGPIRKILKS